MATATVLAHETVEMPTEDSLDAALAAGISIAKDEKYHTFKIDGEANEKRRRREEWSN